MKKVLVTGANGFVGWHLCHRFMSMDYKVFPFMRSINLESISAFSPDIVIHCAAEIRKPELMFDSNIVLTKNVLEQCRLIKNLESMIYIGSSSEYGRKNKPMCETDFLEPDSMYEATKACCTMLTRTYAKTYGIPAKVVRPFTLYGPREAENRFIPTIYNSYKSGNTMKINEGVHDFVYIDDFVDGILNIIFTGNKKYDITNLGTGRQHSNEEVVHVFEEVVGSTIKYDVVDTPMGQAGIDSAQWVADTYHALYEYGWSAKTNLYEGIKRYVQYRESIV